MADFHLGDLLLLKSDGGAGGSLERLARQRDRVLEDLTRVLPRLQTLEFGELTSRCIPSPDGFVLRLLLQPRQRNLLAAPRRTNRSFEAEAQQLRADLLELGPTLRREARASRRRRPMAGVRDVDLMHELLVRRSREQWRIQVADVQLELVFPDCPSYRVDQDVCNVRGTVRSVSARGADTQEVVLAGATVWTCGPSPSQVLTTRHLSIYVAHAGSRGLVEVTSGVVICGRPWNCLAHLHWCVLTGVVMGATFADPPP